MNLKSWDSAWQGDCFRGAKKLLTCKSRKAFLEKLMVLYKTKPEMRAVRNISEPHEPFAWHGATCGTGERWALTRNHGFGWSSVYFLGLFEIHAHSKILWDALNKVMWKTGRDWKFTHNPLTALFLRDLWWDLRSLLHPCKLREPRLLLICSVRGRSCELNVMSHKTGHPTFSALSLSSLLKASSGSRKKQEPSGTSSSDMS